MTRVAFLVIHGIGDQMPYATLDQFTQGLGQTLARLGNHNLTWQHNQIKRAGASGESWYQHYISAASDGGIHNKNNTGESVRSIDVYEHYWAHRMTGQADLEDIFDFLDVASHNANEFYGSMTGDGGAKKEDCRADCKDQRLAGTCCMAKDRLEQQPENPIERMKEGVMSRELVTGGKNPGFNDDGYIRLMAKHWRWVKFGKLVVRIGARRSRILGFLYELAKWKLKGLESVVGDVVAYVQTDKKSKHFALRQSIIKDARDMIASLVNDDRYDRVIVAGHSLGSVIAYDSLGRLNKGDDLLGENKSKVRLVTFGSPLDKIYFFFSRRDERLGLQDQKERGDPPIEQDWDEVIDDTPYLRTRMLQQMHSLQRGVDDKFDRLKGAHHKVRNIDLKDNTNNHLAGLRWINFYNYRDPISGHLDAYKTYNARLRVAEDMSAIEAHSNYWIHHCFYEQMLETFVFETQQLDSDNRPV